MATTALTAVLPLDVAVAQTLPTGASVAAGSVAISRPSATSLTVTQSSQSAVVNYQSFSVGQGSSVNFVQPNASSAILNRVTSSAPSTIAGQVNANGQVHLVNPNGIAITKSGTVNAGGGFVASTLGINDSDFMAGKRTFTGTGSSAGVSNAGTISNAYSTGAVSAVMLVGGFANYNYNDGPQTLANVFWDTQTSGRNNAVALGNSTGATGLTTAQARTSAAYTGFDFANVWYQAGDMRPILRSEAAAAVNGVIPVSNLHQLQLMGANLAGSYVLTGNIDASATASTMAASGIFGAGGFAPVGTATSQFSGSLNGADQTIIGLTINRSSTNNVGLVGYLGSPGSISNLGLVGGSIVGNNTVGGLVGYNNGTITRAYATDSVFGYSSSVGGLVGFNSSSISQSYATGSVSGLNQTYTVGGLVGSNLGSISQTYATGNVSGGSNVGGLAGGSFGGISASYWDKDTTGRMNGVGGGLSAGTTGLSASGTSARSASSYSSFDFTNVWYQAGDMRPILRSEAATAVNGVIPVSNLHQLQLMGVNLAGSYRLTNDIDASATNSTASSAGIFGAGGFVPVGAIFTGRLDGAGYTVSGLTIARPDQSYVGLIGYLGSSGRVSGLGLVNVSIAGNDFTGALVGFSAGGINQVYVTGNVSGDVAVGGLVGNNAGNITQAYTTANVSATGNAIGGLVGANGGGASVRPMPPAT